MDRLARLDAIAGLPGYASATTAGVYAKIIEATARNLEELMGLNYTRRATSGVQRDASSPSVRTRAYDTELICSSWSCSSSENT
jgi:hypothetical protein